MNWNNVNESGDWQQKQKKHQSGNDNDNEDDESLIHIINTQQVTYNPKCVGAINWDYVFTRAMRYGEKPNHPSIEEMTKMDEFLNDFFYNLGCQKKCTSHVIEFAKKCPAKLDSRSAIVFWLLILQNSVNENLGKPIITKKQLVHKYTVELLNKSSHLNEVENKLELDSRMIIMILIFSLILIALFVTMKWLWGSKKILSSSTNDSASENQ